MVLQLLKATGSRKGQKIYFDFKILNTGPNIDKFSIPIGHRARTNIQYDGQVYHAGRRNLAGCTDFYGCSMDLKTNNPLKVQLVFSRVLESGNTIAYATIFGVSPTCEFTFQNIPIEWID